MLAHGWRWVKLGEICEINSRKPKEIVRDDSAPTTFIPMDAVNAIEGKADTQRTRPYEELNRGYTYFVEGDVLFAKITPCMQNGKHFIASGLLGGIGFASTEFHVLRPDGSVIAAWVHFYLRQTHVLEEATYHFTGAVGQQRVPASFLKMLKIPLPPLPEQKRIVAELNSKMAAVEKARTAAEAELEAINALPAAFLRQALFAKKSPPQGWRQVKLGNVCTEDRHTIDGKSFEASKLPYLSLENIESLSGRIILNSNSNTNILGISNCFYFGPGHVLYGKLRPYLNKVALPDFSGRCTTEAIPLLSNSEIDRQFLALILRRPETVDWVMAESIGSRMPRANIKHLMRLEIPLPPLSEQKRIVAELNTKIAAVEKAQIAAGAELEAINALPAAFLCQAFRGEL